MDIAKQSALASSVITDQTFSDAPEECFCPEEVEYIWEWFTELDATRQNGMGKGPITHQEITCWASGMKIDLLPFERRALRAIDRAFLVHSYSKDKNG